MSYQNQSDSNHFSKILELEFKIGGFPAGQDRLILEGNKISVTPTPWARREAAVTHIPSDEEWMEFSQSLKQLKVWGWKENYRNPLIEDGTQWDLWIRTDSSEIDSGGSNKFPTNFNKFIKSIDKLINQDYFEEDY
ncbi:uncharacterized protein METZ01_LOCUS479676, partial [marine metagenome]